MESSNVEVLVDKRSGDISIVVTDDRDSEAVAEATLSVAQAWDLVTKLNSAIQSLSTPTKPRSRGRADKPQTDAVSALKVAPSAPQVRAAVLDAVGAPQGRPRHSPPGESFGYSPSSFRPKVIAIDLREL